MRRQYVFVIGTLSLCALLAALPSTAGVINPGFETGDLTGWTNNGASVVTSYTAQNGTVYGPMEGVYFALLSGNSMDAPGLFGLTQADFNPYNPSGASYYGGAAIAQSVSLNAGETLSFYYLFYADDYLPFTDSAFFVAQTGTISLLASIPSVGGQNGSTGWKTFSWTAPETATYNIGFIILNGGDNAYNSHLAVDAIPEPGTMALLCAGLVGLALWRRRTAR